MFEAKLLEGKKIKQIFESIKSIGYIFNMDLSSDGIILQSMSKDLDILIHLNLDNTTFDYFKCDIHVNLRFLVYVLSELMKAINDDDNVTMIYKNGDRNITFKMENNSK